MGLFAVIDIGGTSIKYGVINEDGTLLETNDRDTEAYKGGLSIIDKVKDIIHDLKINNDISGIGVSTAELIKPCSTFQFMIKANPIHVPMFKQTIE